MNDSKQRWSDVQIEQIMGNLLRLGVILAATVVAIGGAVYLLRHGAEPAGRLSRFNDRPPPEVCSPVAIVHSAFSGQGRGIIQVGILLMIAIPLARVVFSVWAFVQQHDYVYVAITLLVLAILCYSLISGQAS